MDKLLNLSGPTAVPDLARAPAATGPGTGKIHIRIQQMGKKWITTVEGLDSDLDQQRIARAIKRAFQCAASVHRDEETDKEYIKLQGNHRDTVVRWLVEQEVISERERKERVILHGA